MGLTNKQQGTFVTLTLGKFRVKSSEDNPESIKRTKKTGNIIHELVHDTLDGVLRAASLIPSTIEDYSDQFRFEFLDDMNETFILFISTGASANKFINKLINTTINQNIEMTVHFFEDGTNKNKTEFTFVQNNTKIERKFTKDNPGNMPSLSKPYAELDKKEKNNFIVDMDMFFEEELLKFVKQIDITVETEPPEVEQPSQSIEQPEDTNDDLPF